MARESLPVTPAMVRKGFVSPAVQWTLTSLGALIALSYLAIALPPDARRVAHVATEVRVYCASGVAGPVEQALERLRDERDIQARVERTGGSGDLFGQVTMEVVTGNQRGADLLISADASLLERGRVEGVIVEIFPLARQHPVIATYVDSGYHVDNLQQMVAAGNEHPFGIAGEQAAIGRVVRELASRHEIIEALLTGRKLETENVMQLAQAIVSHSLHAAVVWDTTVIQVNRQNRHEVLRVVARLDDGINPAGGMVAMGIVQSTRNRQQAEVVARFLAAPSGGRSLLRAAGFDGIMALTETSPLPSAVDLPR